MKLKRMQYDIPKMRAGGSKAVWKFSENSSVLETPTIFDRNPMRFPPLSIQNERLPWVYSEKCMSPMNIESQKEVSN